MKRLSKECKFYPCTTWNYKNDYFQGGLVKNSPHKVNTVYLRADGGLYLHLTNDEALAVIGCLTEALWQYKSCIRHKKGWLGLRSLEKIYAKKKK